MNNVDPVYNASIRLSWQRYIVTALPSDQPEFQRCEFTENYIDANPLVDADGCPIAGFFSFRD